MFKTETQPMASAKIFSLPLDAFNVFLPNELHLHENFLQATPTAQQSLFTRVTVKPNEHLVFEGMERPHLRMLLNLSDNSGGTIAFIHDRQQWNALQGIITQYFSPLF